MMTYKTIMFVTLLSFGVSAMFLMEWLPRDENTIEDNSWRIEYLRSIMNSSHMNGERLIYEIYLSIDSIGQYFPNGTLLEVFPNASKWANVHKFLNISFQEFYYDSGLSYSLSVALATAFRVKKPVEKLAYILTTCKVHSSMILDKWSLRIWELRQAINNKHVTEEEQFFLIYCSIDQMMAYFSYNTLEEVFPNITIKKNAEKYMYIQFSEFWNNIILNYETSLLLAKSTTSI